MKFNFHKEFKEFSGVLKKHFGYRLEYRTVPLGKWKMYILDIVKPETAATGRQVLFNYTSWKCSNCFQSLYEYLSKYGVFEHIGIHVEFPEFHSAAELRMKLELRGN